MFHCYIIYIFIHGFCDISTTWLVDFLDPSSRTLISSIVFFKNFAFVHHIFLFPRFPQNFNISQPPFHSLTFSNSTITSQVVYEVLHCARVFMNFNIGRSQFTRRGGFLVVMPKWTSKPSHS